ncbi:hypothetical protein, partial [Klebsiella pneumoniae]
RFYAGWRLRLTRPTFVRPAVNLFTIVAETAGADGLKIAETFPEGRGSLQARASAAPPGDGIRHGVAFMPGGGCALPGLRSYNLPLIYSPFLLKLPVLTASKSLRHSRKAVAVSRPGKRSAAGRWLRERSRFYAGWRLRLTRPTFVRPAVNLFTIVAETAGADGLKIAETFPEGR